MLDTEDAGYPARMDQMIQPTGELHSRAQAWTSDEALQAAIEARLRELGVGFLRLPAIGRGLPELVMECMPTLLLEMSLSGESRKVADAVLNSEPKSGRRDE
jgi:hypothetical protein